MSFPSLKIFPNKFHNLLLSIDLFLDQNPSVQPNPFGNQIASVWFSFLFWQIKDVLKLIVQIATLFKHSKNCELCHSLNVNHFHRYLKVSQIKKYQVIRWQYEKEKSHWFDIYMRWTRSLSSTQHSLVKLWKHFVSVIGCSVLSTEAFRVSATNRQTQCSADKIKDKHNTHQIHQ